MNVAVLKRLAALESTLVTADTPSLIMIFYDERREEYVVRETYSKAGAGRKAKQGDFRQKEVVFDHYSGYIFREKYNCSVILDNMNDPAAGDGANLYAFTVKEMRKGARIGRDQAFSISNIKAAPDGGINSEFEITVYERT